MVKFTSREIRDIIISMAVVSLVFAYIFAGRDLNSTIFFMPITFVVVGLGFVLHELSHKYVAIRLWILGRI